MSSHPLYGSNLPADWELTVVDAVKATDKSSCVAGPFGSNIASKYFVDAGVPVIRGSNLRDDLTRFVPEGFVYVSKDRAEKYMPQHVRGGDLVFTCWGTIGQVGLIPSDGPYPEYIISNKQLKLRPNRELADPLYLFYYFASPAMVDYIRGRAVGSAVPGINLGILKSLPVVLPPLPTQRRIAAALAAYDDLIENNRRRIAILEDIARLLYREWFVHFRFPGHADVALVDSDLGTIPAGWERETLADAAHLVMGQSPKSEFYNDERNGLPFHQGVTNFGSRYPEHKTWCSQENRVAEAGDILLSVRAPVGRINVAPERLVIGRGLAALRSRRETQVFLFETLREVFAEEDSMGGGTIFKAVTKKDLERIALLRPPPPLVQEFEEAVWPMFDLVRSLTFQMRALTDARDLLLPRLMSNELDASQLDLELEAVA